jgi:hypothetical protein
MWSSLQNHEDTKQCLQLGSADPSTSLFTLVQQLVQLSVSEMVIAYSCPELVTLNVLSFTIRRVQLLRGQLLPQFQYRRQQTVTTPPWEKADVHLITARPKKRCRASKRESHDVN